MENELPPAELPEDSVTRIEAAQARATYDLREEVRQYWLSISACESRWKKAQPADLAPMFGRYLVTMTDAYARETLPQSISKVDKFLESVRVRLRDELIRRILPQKGHQRLPIIGYRETLEFYEERIAKLRTRSKIDGTEDATEFLCGGPIPGDFFGQPAISPRALPDTIPNSLDGLWETVVFDTWKDVRREQVVAQYWQRWPTHPFQHAFRAITTDDLLPENSLYTRLFISDLAPIKDRALELSRVEALEALVRQPQAQSTFPELGPNPDSSLLLDASSHTPIRQLRLIRPATETSNPDEGAPLKPRSADVAADDHTETESGLNWENVEIRFTSKHLAQVTVRGKSEVLNFTEMGFEDCRTKKPNRAWQALLVMATSDGIISNSQITGGTWPLVEKRMQEARKLLRKHFDISADPLPFVRGSGYRATFKIHCASSFHLDETNCR